MSGRSDKERLDWYATLGAQERFRVHWVKSELVLCTKFFSGTDSHEERQKLAMRMAIDAAMDSAHADHPAQGEPSEEYIGRMRDEWRDEQCAPTTQPPRGDS